MYESQTAAAIQQRKLALISDELDKSEGSYIWDATQPSSIEMEQCYVELDKILALGFADTSYGEWLEKKAAERGVYRNAATKGSGYIEVTMTVGSQITAGDVLATKESNIRLVAVETKVIGESGKELVLFENEEAGNFGNIPVNTVFVAPVSIPGLISATNPATINAGTEEETDAALLQRYHEKIRTPATSGNQYHYRNWSKEIAGVGAAKVIPLWNGANTVKVLITDANMNPAAQALVDEVQQYIDPEASGLGSGKAPIGAFCTVASAQGVDVNVSATIVGADTSTVIPIFEEALTAYLKESIQAEWPEKNSLSISYARIGAILLDSISKAGGTDYTDLTVNGTTGNITLQNDQIPVKGTVILS